MFELALLADATVDVAKSSNLGLKVGVDEISEFRRKDVKACLHLFLLQSHCDRLYGVLDSLLEKSSMLFLPSNNLICEASKL